MTNTTKVGFRTRAGAEVTADEIYNHDGSIRLLVDIDETICIPKGQSRRIPTPIQLHGDGRTIALMEVYAGAAQDYAPIRLYEVVPEGEVATIGVMVVNEQDATLMIQPNYSLGLLRVIAVQGAEPAATADVPVQEAPDVTRAVAARFEPLHLPVDQEPRYETAGAAGMDLKADLKESLVLQPGERELVKTGLRIAIPHGMEAQVRPRSGLAFKHGISVTNSPGTIDSDYRGEVGVLLHNLGNEPFTVVPGERIAQLVFAPIVRAALDFHASLSDTARSTGGFGSTGRR